MIVTPRRRYRFFSALLGTLVFAGVNAAALQTKDRSSQSPSKVMPFALRLVELLRSPFKEAMERNAKCKKVRRHLMVSGSIVNHATQKTAGGSPSI
jgi:hypothetical protein